MRSAKSLKNIHLLFFGGAPISMFPNFLERKVESFQKFTSLMKARLSGGLAAPRSSCSYQLEYSKPQSLIRLLPVTCHKNTVRTLYHQNWKALGRSDRSRIRYEKTLNSWYGLDIYDCLRMKRVIREGRKLLTSSR